MCLSYQSTKIYVRDVTLVLKDAPPTCLDLARTRLMLLVTNQNAWDAKAALQFVRLVLSLSLKCK
ncbi:hypothetical protein DP73_09245 [Desulfosporosinus sp. HMP52]|nr:hypothetical protein DP73_09245 [Desulfosporosinus sp. HMP52]